MIEGRFKVRGMSGKYPINGLPSIVLILSPVGVGPPVTIEFSPCGEFTVDEKTVFVLDFHAEVKQ